MPVVITQYKWAGQWGPFKITSRCNECDVTTAVLKDLINKEFAGGDVVLEIKPWLDNAWHCLARGAWHAPIIMVNDKRFYQYSHGQPLFDRLALTAHVKGLLSR